MGAPAARAAELAAYWVKEGHEVTILTGFPNHPTGVIPPEYRSKFWRLATRERAGDVNVVRSWLLPFPNRKAHERMLNYSSFCLSASTTGMFLSRPDVVIATSPQLLVGLSGWWLARIKDAPFIFEVRDLWPESLAAVGMGSPNSALHRGLGRVAGFLYRKCQQVVVVTPAFKDHLMQHWRLPQEKISVVENGVETQLFCPGSGDANLRKQLGAEGKFVVCYIGTLGMAHGLETLVEAASRLRESAPQVLFVLVGEGSEKQRILAMATSRGLNNLRFVAQQPREKIPDYVRTADACLVLLRRTELFKTVIPTKMLEFMSCGRPVIVGVDGQARQIVEEAKAGLYIPPENAAALAEAVVRLATDAALRESLGANGRRKVLRDFARERTARDYLSVLGGVARGAHAQSRAAASGPR